MNKPVKLPIITLLAGNSSHLAYALGYKRSPRSRRLRGKCGYHVADPNSEFLWVRSRSGHQRDLGKVPAWLKTDLASFVGSTLYAETFNWQDPEALPIVYWWNVKDNMRGHAKVPAGSYYLGGGPSGFLVSDGHHVFEQSPSGHRTQLPGAADEAVSNETGFVEWHGRTAGMTYTTYAHLHRHRALSYSARQLACPTITATDVGCYNIADDDSRLSSAVTALIPLSGAAAVTWTTRDETGFPVSLAEKDKLVWATFHNVLIMSKAHPTPRRGLGSLRIVNDYLTVKESDPFANEHDFEVDQVSAYGGAAMINAARSRVVLVHGLGKPRLLFTLRSKIH